jgi:hypothetical protein
MDRIERPAKADRVAAKPGKRSASQVAKRPPDKTINDANGELALNMAEKIMAVVQCEEQ